MRCWLIEENRPNDVGPVTVHVTPEESVNCRVLQQVDTLGALSDGSHTFDELYEHRIALWIELCSEIHHGDSHLHHVWRSKIHSDGTSFEGWFVLGMDEKRGRQITYHLPMSKWALTGFAETLDRAPEWDGHTSADVLKRISLI